MNGGKEWTEEESATLAGMKRAGLPAWSIAQRLGRSKSAIGHQAHKLKIYSRLDNLSGRHHNPAQPPVRG